MKKNSFSESSQSVQKIPPVQKIQDSVRDVKHRIAIIANIQDRILQVCFPSRVGAVHGAFLIVLEYYGFSLARPVKRLIQRELVNSLAREILEGKIRKDSAITVDAGPGGVMLRQG